MRENAPPQHPAAGGDTGDFGSAMDRYITGSYGEDQFRRPGVNLRDGAIEAMSKARDAFWVARAGTVEAVEVLAMERKADLAALDGLIDWLTKRADTSTVDLMEMSAADLLDMLRGEERGV